MREVLELLIWVWNTADALRRLRVKYSENVLLSVLVVVKRSLGEVVIPSL